MRLLVSGATKTIREVLAGDYDAYRYLGHLLTPHNYNAITTLMATGLPICCDNSCFGGLDLPAMQRMLIRLQP